MADFKIYFDNSSIHTDDQFTVKINSVLIGRYDLSTKMMQFVSTTKPGWNSLEISFDRKVLGTYVSIDEIFIDHSAMKYLVNDFGQVFPDYRLDPGLEQWFVETHGQAPNNFPKRKLLDMPGIFNFRFCMPLQKFLDDFYKIPDSYTMHYNQPIDRYLQLEQRLSQTR